MNGDYNDYNKNESSDTFHSLDQGERDTITCFESGGMDLIITDDGRAARYCREKGVPFINALLFPRLLYFAARITKKESWDKMATLIRLGRYTPEIIEWAKNCSRESLSFAASGSAGN